MEKSSATASDLNKKKRDVTTVWTAASFALSFLLVGLPLWWKTTNVFRVSLPYSEIQQLSSLEIGHVIPVTVVLTDRYIQQGILWEELTLLSRDEYNSIKPSELLIQYAWKMRTISSEEEKMLRNSQNIYNFDGLLNNSTELNEPGVYNVFIVETTAKFPNPTQLVGCHRRAYVSSDPNSFMLARNIISVVRTMSHADLLQHIYNPPSSYERKKPDKDRMRSLSATTAFHITFSLIVPEPHMVNVEWDIQRAIEAYINPFMSKISTIADVEMKSQILYMMSLPMQITYSRETGDHFLMVDNLPSIINPVESKLSSYASVNPTLNFVVYIPPKGHQPLYLVDNRGNQITTNAFLSPQWGGFLILNTEETNSSIFPQGNKLDVQGMMEIFLPQLKLLLGLPDRSHCEQSPIEILQEANGCGWELDYLLRKNTQEQLSIAASSLFSLGNLLKTISNIVIDDDVGNKIYNALASIKSSMQSLNQGLLEEGFYNAKKAFVSSEAAFFDPSLLALLYFPDDQKYAIYIPLFLPISIPVIISLRQIWSYWKDKKEKKE